MNTDYIKLVQLNYILRNTYRLYLVFQWQFKKSITAKLDKGFTIQNCLVVETTSKRVCAWIQSKSAFENLCTIHERVIGFWVPCTISFWEFSKLTQNENSIHERIIIFNGCTNKKQWFNLNPISKVHFFKSCAQNHEIQLRVQTKILTLCI